MNDGPFAGFTWRDFFRVAFVLSALVWAGGLMFLVVGVLLAAAARSEPVFAFVTLIAMVSIPGGALGAILSAIGVQVTRLLDTQEGQQPPEIKCPRCNGQIHGQPPVCPHCGLAIAWQGSTPYFDPGQQASAIQRPPAPGKTVSH